MPICPRCNAIVEEGATFCKICGYSLEKQRLEAFTTQPLSYGSDSHLSRTYANYSLICSLLSLFLIPELFGSIAIILAAYSWKMEQGNRGLKILVFAIISMIMGMYFTAVFALIDLLF